MNEKEKKQEVSYPEPSGEIKQLLADIGLAAGKTFWVDGVGNYRISLPQAIELALAAQTARTRVS